MTYPFAKKKNKENKFRKKLLKLNSINYDNSEAKSIEMNKRVQHKMLREEKRLLQMK